MDFAARVGIAFHRTLESLNEDAPETTSLAEAAQEVERRFEKEIERQRQESSCRQRERFLPQDETRISVALEGVVSEAIRLVRLGLIVPRRLSVPSHAQQKELRGVEVEVYVRSRDGLFQGLIDRVEHTVSGPRLVDIKSALRTDLPERYERQLQMYAYLWSETRREWPSEAIIIFPLTGRHFSVCIDRQVVESVIQEATEAVRLVDKSKAEDLATPGDVCKVCEFRPWCVRFWKWVEEKGSWATRLERAGIGWQGVVEKVERGEGQWRLQVKWQSSAVQVAVKPDDFAHIEQARPGTVIRLLDVRLRGVPQYLQAGAEGRSEIFFVRRPAPL